MEAGGRRLERQLGRAGLQKTQTSALGEQAKGVFHLLLGGDEPRGLAGLYEPKHKPSCWNRLCAEEKRKRTKGSLDWQQLPEGPLECPSWAVCGTRGGGAGHPVPPEPSHVRPSIAVGCIPKGKEKAFPETSASRHKHSAEIPACPAERAPGNADGFPRFSWLPQSLGSGQMLLTHISGALSPAQQDAFSGAVAAVTMSSPALAAPRGVPVLLSPSPSPR